MWTLTEAVSVAVVMETLEQEIESILLSVAVEKPKPDYSGVYAGLYVFPAMTEGFIRTCIVVDIMKAARQYYSLEEKPDPQHSVATGSDVASAAPRDLPAERAPGGNNLSR